MVFKIKFANEISQIFTSKKNINLIFFNIFGLQVLRYLLAKITFLFSKFFFQDSKLLGTYENKGVYLIENFLPEKDFLKVQAEFSKIFDDEKRARNTYKDSPDRKNSSIDYYLYEFKDNFFNSYNYPNLYQVLKNKKINDFFKFA